MVSIEFHFVAWICFIIGIFCAGMWLGYKLAEGTPSASHNKQSAPFMHCVHCVHLEQSTLNCKLSKCVNTK
jgi:hypothetical protein